MKAPNTGYIPVVESLRGLAASAVCFYHFVWGTVDYVNAPWARVLTYWGQYGVTLFFVLSGVVLPLSLLRHNYQWRNFGRYLWRRCWRLEPPYLLSILVVLGYLAAQAWRHGQPFLVDWSNLILHLGYCIPLVEGEQWLNPVYWSLAVEFQYYGILGLLFPLWAAPAVWKRYSIYFICLMLSWASVEKDLIFRWLPLFLMSGCYVLYIERLIKLIEFSIIIFTGSIILLLNLHWVHAGVVLGTLALLHFFPSYNPKPLSWLGRCSYSLYLLHWPIGQALINVLSHSYRLPFQKVLVLLLGYGSSVLAAALFYHFVERPSQQKATQVGYGQAVN